MSKQLYVLSFNVVCQNSLHVILCPVGHRITSCTSALREKNGEGSATKEILMTVLLSNSRKGLTADRKSKLDRQRAEMKVKIGRKEEGKGQQGRKEKKGINSEKNGCKRKINTREERRRQRK